MNAVPDSTKSASMLLPSVVPGPVIWFPPQRPSLYFIQSMMLTSALLHLIFSSLLLGPVSFIPLVMLLSSHLRGIAAVTSSSVITTISVLSFLLFFYQYSCYVNNRIVVD